MGGCLGGLEVSRDWGCLGPEDLLEKGMVASWERYKMGSQVGNFRETRESSCTGLKGLATITGEQRGQPWAGGWERRLWKQCWGLQGRKGEGRGGPPSAGCPPL